MAEQFIGVEATGVYEGTLVEDMIETVKREKKLYCNVHIPKFFAKDSGYPLTYVPFWAMSLPLKEGDKVLVEFHQSNLMYPVLYKNPDEIDKLFYEKFDTNKSVNGGNISGYTAKDTVGCERIGENSYLIKTDDYTVIHQNNGFILIDKDDKIYMYGNGINIISAGTFKIDSNQAIDIYTNSDTKIESKGKCDIKSTGECKVTANGNFTVNGHLKVTV